ncbi:MAG: hypothetical protein QM662_08540 [Gordonia sp. (in: high G+C Gram-positive bacteria)]
MTDPLLRDLDDVVAALGHRISRRSLMEQLRPGRRFDGCAGKLAGRWVFTDADVDRLLARLHDDSPADDDAAAGRSASVRVLPSGMSPRSPRARQATR